MASNILRPIKKGKSKSTKDKTRNIQLHPDISNPATASHITHIVTQPGEGLYHKLMQHKQSISMQISVLTTALENGHIQYTSRHNKLDMTTVITSLLVQINSAITTTHQCVTRDIMDKNGSYRVRLEVNEKEIYENLALLVRWVDFDSKTEKEKTGEEEEEKLRVMEGVKRFQYALEEVVRLVYEVQIGSDFGSRTLPMNVQRRVSVDSGTVNSVQHSDELAHPSLAALKGDSRDRKISWSPGSGSGSAGSYRDKSMSRSPMSSRVSAEMTSEGSSTSDEEKRRSGSVERHYHSPDHLRGSVSPEWDGRYRSATTPIDHTSYSTSLSSSMTYSTSIPPPVGPTATGLPPLPGEIMDGAPPPPLPKRGEMEDSGLHVPPVPRKGHTLPRTSVQLNGLYGGGNDAKPPPLPAKKKHSAMKAQINGHGNAAAVRPMDNEQVPPPLPLKQKQRRHGTTVGSPQHTPTHHFHSLSSPVSSHGPLGYITADSLARSFGTSSYQRGSGSSDGMDVHVEQYQPPVPMRMESIPGVKNALVQDTPPPKPPRTDVPNAVPQASPQHTATPRASMAGRTAREEEVFNAVRKYNEDLMKAKESGPDVAPPLPLKKKTIMMYRGLLDGYRYDESMTQSLFIPGMEAPPPIPPKKRKRRPPQSSHAAAAAPPGQTVINTSTLSKPELNASTEEVFNEDTEESGEPNYLECDDSSGYLTFHKEDGGYTLRGGPVDAFIAYAASSTKAVKHFSEAFLLTYYTFITPEELITKLLYRLDYFYKSGTAAIWQSTISLLVRVLTGLNQPLVKDAQVKLIGLVHDMISDGNLKFAQLLRNALVDKLNQLLPDTRSQLTLGVTMRGSGKTTRKTLLEYSADDLAKQMTILDNELFQKVDVCEMLYWAKEQNEEKSPMLTQFTMHFNNVSQWTKVQILKKGADMKARIKVIAHFISIMKCLRDNHNNFNSYLAILSAIESSPISRLDWPDKVQKGLEAPRQLIDNRGSFKNYREAFAGAKPPCIPYIGLYLQDLTFIEMQPSKLEEDESAINFTKRWKQFKSVDHIRFAQTKQYTYTPDPEILSLFWNFETDITDEALWSISHEIKPSARAQRTQHQT